MRRIALAGVVILGIVGCSGEMQGTIAGSSARPTIAWQQGMNSDRLTITMPDGEAFQGRVVAANQAETIGFGSVWGGRSGSYYGSTTTGQMVGKLLSNRGRAMDCQFQYADSSGLTNAGGVGTCMIVGGERIDIVW